MEYVHWNAVLINENFDHSFDMALNVLRLENLPIAIYLLTLGLLKGVRVHATAE